jgi:saccharopine dehydrogenase-like NADP-dependent oxidoreductase
MNNAHVLTILGSAGGVAKSFLSILNQSAVDQKDYLYGILANCEIHLVDYKQKGKEYYVQLFPNLQGKFVFHQFDLRSIDRFTEHLISTGTGLVIDVSWGDTVDLLRCCNKQGVKYVNTAMENTYIDDNEEQFYGFPLAERMDYFEKYKGEFTNTSAIICSGMNPGVVQWMALELLKGHKEQPLGCYIVEEDSTFFKDGGKARKNVIYTTWSPECFLDEAIASYPMLVKNNTPLFLYEDVYDIEFKVTLGDKEFFGCLMPHEEVYTLGKISDMECGFLYKVNDHTTELIRSNLADVDRLWDYEMEVLDPGNHELAGKDLVGVLLVYEDKEVFMYNMLETDQIYPKFQTNATYFQVACGLYGAACVLLLDGVEKGLYYVDELLLHTKNHYGKYVTYYLTDFVKGENHRSEGLLLDRMRRSHKKNSLSSKKD